jgi:hypothetical protein
LEGCAWTLAVLQVCGGKFVVAVHPDRIEFSTGSYRRAPGAPPSVPVWQFKGRA